MSNVTVLNASIPSLHMAEAELVKVLESSLYPGAKPESIKLVIGYCKAAGLDPMQKPVHIVPIDVKTGRKDNNGKDIYEKRDVIMPGVGLYRIQAARSKEYAGMTEPEFGPDKTRSLGKDDDKTDFTFPEWCKVTVRRVVEGRPVDFTATEYWIENYATAGKWTTAPNAMWKKRPRGQIAKCAEAQALRKAFPELGAAPTAEEMEGKVIDHDPQPIAPRIEQPKAEGATYAVDPSDPAGGGSGGVIAGQQTEVKDSPMTEGQKRILRAKLKAASLNDVDLKAKFGKALGAAQGEGDDGWMFSDFQKVQDWIKSRAGQ
jgi:phage recombination protein Bet